MPSRLFARFRRGDVPERCLKIGSSGAHEAVARRTSNSQDCETFLRVAAQGLDMQTGDGLDDGAARGVKVAELDKVVGQSLALVARPGGECRE
jgi:hypothetical protein